MSKYEEHEAKIDEALKAHCHLQCDINEAKKLFLLVEYI